jgi:hypothetical protein
MAEEAADVWNALNSVFAEGHMTRELFRKLDEAQKRARVDGAFVDLSYAFRQANPRLDDGEIRRLIAESYAKRDAELEARIVTTSKFGNLVAEKIQKE